METESIKAEFFDHLRKILNCLYDPAVLRSSPLIQWFQVKSPQRAAPELRNTLINAIEALRPQENTPLDSRTWRVYQILRRRYTEQLTQQQVATDLGLSVRQLQREEKLAREVLGEFLWATYELQSQIPPAKDENEAEGNTPLTDSDFPSRDEELEWLRNSVPAKTTHILDILEEVQHTLTPLLTTSQVKIIADLAEKIPPTHVREPLLRQALLNLISIAVQCTADTAVHLQAHPNASHLEIKIRTPIRPEHKQVHVETLNMADQLIQLCKGNLDITWQMEKAPAFMAHIILPIEAQIAVLVIDDNADVLQLFERYLDNSRYCFIGAQDAEIGLELAQTAHPELIVLDVMMPGRDGWALLGQLREHPQTQDIPVIVCTILSQAELATALGAADFIRKPVKRAEFIAALDQQVAQTPKAPDS